MYLFRIKKWPAFVTSDLFEVGFYYNYLCISPLKLPPFLFMKLSNNFGSNTVVIFLWIHAHGIIGQSLFDK